MYGLYLAIEAEKVMKLLVVFATLFAVIHVYAIPVREKARTAFQPIVLSKAVGDIWSDCSEFEIKLAHYSAASVLNVTWILTISTFK